MEAKQRPHQGADAEGKNVKVKGDDPAATPEAARHNNFAAKGICSNVALEQEEEALQEQ